LNIFLGGSAFASEKFGNPIYIKTRERFLQG